MGKPEGRGARRRAGDSRRDTVRVRAHRAGGARSCIWEGWAGMETDYDVGGEQALTDFHVTELHDGKLFFFRGTYVLVAS